MAMFPNATKGYMPFVCGHKRQIPVKKQKHDNYKVKKTYQVTLKDKSGKTFTYIVKTDGTKSLPVLCENMMGKLGSTDSLPNIGLSSPKRKSFDLKDLRSQVENEKKQGLFSTFINFFKDKTGKSSKSGKSKRKSKPLEQRKRKRTVSAMSNLDPIQESPDEDAYADDDTDSYAHDCSSLSDSEMSENISFTDFSIKRHDIEQENSEES
ncbi:uncharacterized protein [Mytilus edulis]|uniref:uncharacterized protein n=1 Tax=Mytilus edulis TaxID=6550 RepID=UPI0039EEB050